MQGHSILRHALQRLLGLVPTLLMLITLAFFLIRIAPGGPFDTEKALPPEIEANLQAKYHLDEPLVQQYFRYLGQLLVLDFGPSFQYRDWTVNELIAEGFPVSLTVGGLAMLPLLVHEAATERRFSDEELVAIAVSAADEASGCAQHLVELITRLNAFAEYSEEYAASEAAEPEPYEQAHAQACQARSRLEAALQTLTGVSEEG